MIKNSPHKSWYRKIVDLFYQEETKQPERKNEVQSSEDSPSVRVFDISGVAPSIVHRPQIYSGAKDWLQLLEIPYERSSLRVTQIKSEVMKLYQELCVFIDNSLIKDGESLSRLKNKLDQGYSYYGNILYTIWCISEGVVTSHYQSLGYDNNFSYDLLKRHTNEDLVKGVKEFCLEYSKKLPPADNETINTFHLTPNGLPYLWWDADGVLREKYNLSKAQVNLLNNSPDRSTKIMEIPELRVYILLHYLSVVELLRDQFRTTDGWSKKMSRYLAAFFDNNTRYWPDYLDAKVLAHLLKLCEQTTRINVPYSRLLKVDEEVAHLKRILPREVSPLLLEKATSLPVPIQLTAETLEALRKQNPTAWKNDIVDFRSMDCQKCIKVLNTYKGDDNFRNIAKEAIRLSGTNITNSLLSCYSYFVIVKKDEWEQVVLQKIKKLITHPEQQSAFSDLVSQNKVLSVELSAALMILTKPPVRTVSLDAKKIQAADAEHTEVVKKVSDYLSENSEEEREPINPSAHSKISVDDLFN